MIVKLDNDQFKALSNIMADIGQVVFAFSVVPFLFNFDKIDPRMLSSGLMLTFGCWIMSVIFAKRSGHD